MNSIANLLQSQIVKLISALITGNSANPLRELNILSDFN